jgi:hypothetical protein
MAISMEGAATLIEGVDILIRGAATLTEGLATLIAARPAPAQNVQLLAPPSCLKVEPKSANFVRT